MSDFEEAPVSALQQVFRTVTVDRWLLVSSLAYAQVVIKRQTEIGLRDAYPGNQYVQKIVRCLLSHLRVNHQFTSRQQRWSGEIVQWWNIRPEIADDGQHVEGLKKLVAYINEQWINKRSVGPERLSVGYTVRDNRSFALTIIVKESYHAALKRQMLVSHLNVFSVYTDDNCMAYT